MATSSYFQSYHASLKRVLFTEMLDEHIQKQQTRRLSIVGPCFTHEQWLLLQAERRRAEAAAAQAGSDAAVVTVE
jgi:hypothetical protein